MRSRTNRIINLSLLVLVVMIVLIAKLSNCNENPAKEKRSEIETIELAEENSDGIYGKDDQKDGKYSSITISDEEMELLAKIVYLEARGESFEGQQAVVEVVFNRVLDKRFPNTVEDVLMDRKYAVQFVTSLYLDKAFPTETQYEAIKAAMESDGIVEDAIYFSTSQLTDNVVMQIGAHYFCA